MATRKGLSGDEAWMRVREFAQECMETARPVFTLRRKVRNLIVDVKPGSICRESDEGRSNNDRVTEGQVQRVWDALSRAESWKEGRHILYFTPALMVAAMPDVLEDLGDGEIGLSRHPKIRAAKKRKQTRDRRAPGGEGDLHRRLRLFIHTDPDRALKRLRSGPWTPYSTEYVFATGDRADVLLRDREGNFVLVEVKPMLEPRDPAPFAQAAKYRTLMHVLEGRDLEAIRTVVAAPNIPKGLAKRMLDEHGVEAVRVDVPDA